MGQTQFQHIRKQATGCGTKSMRDLTILITGKRYNFQIAIGPPFLKQGPEVTIQIWFSRTGGPASVGCRINGVPKIQMDILLDLGRGKSVCHYTKTVYMALVYNFVHSKITSKLYQNFCCNTCVLIPT